jgi:hypothetical protein
VHTDYITDLLYKGTQNEQQFFKTLEHSNEMYKVKYQPGEQRAFNVDSLEFLCFLFKFEQTDP